jgi:hypothetical protein
MTVFHTIFLPQRKKGTGATYHCIHPPNSTVCISAYQFMNIHVIFQFWISIICIHPLPFFQSFLCHKIACPFHSSSFLAVITHVFVSAICCVILWTWFVTKHPKQFCKHPLITYHKVLPFLLILVNCLQKSTSTASIFLLIFLSKYHTSYPCNIIFIIHVL